MTAHALAARFRRNRSIWRQAAGNSAGARNSKSILAGSNPSNRQLADHGIVVPSDQEPSKRRRNSWSHRHTG
jgi:hypothetical protein